MLLVGVIVAMPWGVLADKKGRRFVTSLGILGLLLRQVWGYVVCKSSHYTVKAVNRC